MFRAVVTVVNVSVVCPTARNQTLTEYGGRRDNTVHNRKFRDVQGGTVVGRLERGKERVRRYRCGRKDDDGTVYRGRRRSPGNVNTERDVFYKGDLIQVPNVGSKSSPVFTTDQEQVTSILS